MTFSFYHIVLENPHVFINHCFMHNLKVHMDLRLFGTILKLNLRNCDVFTDLKFIADFEGHSFKRINSTVEEQEIFRSSMQRPKVKANPFFFFNSMVISIEVRFTEPCCIHPHPFPIPSASSEPIESASCLIRLWIECAHFFLELTVFLIPENIVQPDLTVSVTSETFVRNDSIANDGGTLIITTNVSVIRVDFCLVL